MTPFLATATLLASTLLPIPGIPGITSDPEPTSDPAAAEQPVGGRTSAADGVLRAGCHRYRYSYAVSTPYDDWTLETSVLDRRGKAVMSGALIGSTDPRSGVLHYTLCRRATRPGRFTIIGKLVSYDGDEETVVQLPPSTFRLRGRR